MPISKNEIFKKIIDLAETATNYMLKGIPEKEDAETRWTMAIGIMEALISEELEELGRMVPTLLRCYHEGKFFLSEVPEGIFLILAEEIKKAKSWLKG